MAKQRTPSRARQIINETVSGRLKQRVEEAFADPRPNVPAADVFKRLRAYHAQQVKAERDET
jgi:hypothetical protein